MKDKFLEVAREMAELLAKKNEAYGNSFFRIGEVLGMMYPNGISKEQAHDALAIARTLDKLFRIATKKDAFGENPWRDICGYAILSVVREEEGDHIPTALNLITASQMVDGVEYFNKDGTLELVYVCHRCKEEAKVKVHTGLKREAVHRCPWCNSVNTVLKGRENG